MYSAFLLFLLPSIVNAFSNVRIASGLESGECLSTTSDGKTLQMVGCPPPSVTPFWEFNDQEPLTAIRWTLTNTCINVDGNNRVSSQQCDGSLKFNVHFPFIKHINGNCLGAQGSGVIMVDCNDGRASWYMA